MTALHTRPDGLPPAGPDASDLVKLAADHLYTGAEHADPDRSAEQLVAASAYALVAIADSLTRLADRHAANPPSWANLAPAHDDR